MTICEALLTIEGWRVANCGPEEAKAAAPTDEAFEAALAKSAKRRAHG
jgi:hypothetical protein